MEMGSERERERESKRGRAHVIEKTKRREK